MNLRRPIPFSATGVFTMKRVLASLLAVGLLATSVSAFAQSDAGRYDSDIYENNAGTSYDDIAQVIRVDPVLANMGDAPRSTRQCYTTSAGRYSYNDDRYDRGDSRYNNGYYSDRYDDGRDWRNDRYRNGNDTGRNVATIAGGIVGAVLGSKVGGGSGTYAATAVGSMLGGMAGREIYEQNQRNRYQRSGTVRVCDPEPVYGRDADDDDYNRGDMGATAYDVTYEYNGRRYTRRMSYHPGNTLRVRVDVMPQ